MKFLDLKIGDQVSLTNQEITGIITKINGNLITFLSKKEGLELCYHKKELIKIEKIPHIEKLYQEFIPSSYKEPKLNQFKNQKSKKYLLKKTSVLEIDLHGEKLFENIYFLENHQIILKQLETARDALETFISNRTYRKLILIHGNGKRVLREKIRFLIDENYPILEYFDGSYQEYGSGATEVRIK